MISNARRVALLCFAAASASTSVALGDDDLTMTFTRKRAQSVDEFVARKRAPKPKPKPPAPPPAAPVEPPKVDDTKIPVPPPPKPDEPPKPAEPVAAPVAPKPVDVDPVKAAPPVVPPPAAPPAHVVESPPPPRQFDLTVFGDVYGRWGTPKGPETTPGFGVGALNLLFTGDLGSGVSALGELNAEFLSSNQATVDIERVTVRWDRGGAFVESGRVHTELGFWNVAYHHGKYLQPTLERPAWLSFEDDGGVLPVHMIGAQGGYVHRDGDLKLKVLGGFGNGRGAFADDIQNSHDNNNPKEGVVKLQASGLGHADLTVGVSGLYGKIAARSAAERPALPDQSLTETIGNAYVAFTGDRLLFIAEGFAVNHVASGGKSWKTNGGFAVLGYRLGSVWTPYVLAESVRASQVAGATDAFFANDYAAPKAEIVNRSRGILGLRVDTSSNSSVKLEFLTDAVRNEKTKYIGTVGWAFGL